MRRLALPISLCLFLAGCASTGINPDFHGAPFTVRVENHFGYKVHLYWVVAGQVRPTTAARLSPRSRDVVVVPESLRNLHRVGVLVCVGNLTPQTHCSVADGWVRPNEAVGNILIIHSFSYLAAAIT